MPSGFFSAIIFSSALTLLLNILLSTIIVFFAAKILYIPGNSFQKALLVVLSGIAIAILQGLFFPLTFFFSWIVALAAFLWAIKTTYSIDYGRALSLWLISIILPVGVALVLVPAILAALYSVAF
ncbi:MAG: hypothetical protein HYW50_00355 [Candidatus Diapherotrites archaeon]|nr:hypothetical protein [Candidatus Diapherotrites archaeon]